MRVDLRLNYQPNVGVLFNARVRGKMDADGFCTEPVRLQRLARDVMERVKAGANSHLREDDQMPTSPFVITIFLRGYVGRRVFGEITFNRKASCTPFLAGVGASVFQELRTYFKTITEE